MLFSVEVVKRTAIFG